MYRLRPKHLIVGLLLVAVYALVRGIVYHELGVFGL
jgi:hypothetical protein